ncbi:MAG: methyltransferase domain-containing protein [Acidobacteria bacterium]|nr:methyltransferase domain-containing protein [Acidobacteriota bacterium]MYH23506.1 methyltransferase domain-containing protein [Acidobacteriota bacterium]MYK80254.1 methyltransferase domain-containing protein [Acidobacteriota bacterium]
MNEAGLAPATDSLSLVRFFVVPHHCHRHGHGGKRPWWKGFRTTAAIGYVIRHYTEPRNRMVIERAGIRAGDRVVDIGCGPGESVALAAAAAPAVQVVAVDPAWAQCASTALRTLRFRRAVRVRRAAAEKLPVPDGWATLVLSINAFHHWEDRRRGLAEVRRVLAPDGRLVLVDEDFPEHHQHTRFHREAGEDATVDAGSPVVREWLGELGFGEVTLERVEDADGTPHHVLCGARGT